MAGHHAVIRGARPAAVPGDAPGTSRPNLVYTSNTVSGALVGLSNVTAIP